MRILIIGSDGKGSFAVRGTQLGGAIGARVTMQPKPADFRWASVIVLLKRAVSAWGAEAKASGATLIWDVVDFWKQPDQNAMDPGELARQIEETRVKFGITTVIGATKAMATAIGGVYLSHHCRPGLVVGPLNLDANRKLVVGYEGQAKYLGSWARTIKQACLVLGCDFVINPPSLTDLDVVVAFRGEQWDGEVCRKWKSGVKFVNAIAAGKPVVAQACAAFDELAPVGVSVDRGQMVEALRDALRPEMRAAAYEAGLRRANEFSLSSIAHQYRSILQCAAVAA